MQFKKGFKTVTAVALSVALAFAPAISSFAADETSQGVGNILAYNIDTVVVPTAIKLVINPNGYTINKKYVKVASDATHSATTKYYNKQTDGTFKEVKIAAEDWATAKDNAYTAETSTDQVVSFNYGIVNKATRDKTVTVRFDATADSGVEFVDDADKVVAKSGSTDETGAPQDSHRIFLNLVPAKVGTTMTAETKADSTTAWANTVKYYKVDTDGSYVIDTSITDADKLAAAKAAYTVYEDSTAIGKYIKASELVDATMTGSDTAINFAGSDGKAAADVAYMLYRATYNVKQGEILDWDTSYEDIEDKFELTDIAAVSTTVGSEHNGGYSGFTFTGSMNTNTDWADLTTRTITIKPTYEIINATGSEEAVTTGLNQVEAGERSAATVATPSGTGMTAAASGSAWDYEATFTKGTAYDINFTGVAGATWSSTVDGTYAVSANITTGTNKVTIASGNWAGASAGDARFVKVTDGTNTYIIKFTIATN